jgi:hypothetical protein
MKYTSILALAAIALTFASGPAIVLAQPIDPNAPLPTGSNTSRPAPVLPALVRPTVSSQVPSLSQVILPPLSMAEVSQELTSRLLRIPGVRAVIGETGMPNVLRLIAHNDSFVRIDSLLERLNAQNSNREAEYGRLESNIASMLARTDPFKPEQLRIVIRKTDAINAFETESAAGGVRNLVVRRPFIGDLEEVVVGDTPTTIALMPAMRLTDLRLSADQAFERGRGNTATETAGVTWRSVNGLLVARTSSGYETSLLALDSVWAGLAQRLGGPIAVIVPTREKIVIGRADRPRDITRLRALIAAEAKGERMLSNKVWVRRGTTWVER